MTKTKKQQAATDYAQDFLDKLLEKEDKKHWHNLNHNGKKEQPKN